MAKICFKARVNLSSGYAPVKYITRTIEMELPKDRYGFILFNELHKPLREYFSKNIVSKIPERVSGFNILWYQVK
ncbi:hypothetical protein Sgly_0366 [Syntrophobotulus glycolicus DSM 8271]|uniref:Uncharacterized protein n=1 Tax=Syntrophobotulus glycolicus (strain DSM 8271 / FlGlyR) TaxID=645991 RepID=F0SXI6_SYNGF|nr:hypothetical protein Sgly_0366 [Syntrophobotulus glycolicus DSM 8271]